MGFAPITLDPQQVRTRSRTASGKRAQGPA
jgi:hypothetical protein